MSLSSSNLITQNFTMECDCHSRRLYSSSPSQIPICNSQKVLVQEVKDWRKMKTYNIKQKASEGSAQRIFKKQLEEAIYENTSIYFLNSIQKIQAGEIYANPLWFYKNFVAQNKPCIIDGVTDGWEVLDSWKNPQQLIQLCKLGKQENENVSVSLTPDGFADSIVGEYFVEPVEVQQSIQKVIEWKQNSQIDEKALRQSQPYFKSDQCQHQKDNQIDPHLIPYIQHQNSNLTEQKQLQQLHEQIPTDFYTHISNHLFDGSPPDAANFWMGYQYSVSSLHKDPYENFYTPVVGQKHFTLLPPVCILNLPEQEYTTGKWKISSQKRMGIQLNEMKTKWVCANPDSPEDYDYFQEMQQLRDWKMHVVVQAGETLYLPALWYHQVAQTHRKDPYTIAVNSWYDMSFNHMHTLYETARKIKQYS